MKHLPLILIAAAMIGSFGLVAAKAQAPGPEGKVQLQPPPAPAPKPAPSTVVNIPTAVQDNDYIYIIQGSRMYKVRKSTLTQEADTVLKPK